MITLIIVLVLATIGITLIGLSLQNIYTSMYRLNCRMEGSLILVVCIFVFIIAGTTRENSRIAIQNIQSYKELMKDNNFHTEFERIFITNKAVELNNDLAGWKVYRQNSWTSWFIHPSIDTTDYIK